jgi:nitrogen regulatory protein PII
MGFHLITCILERGKANKVIDAALEAGAQAATVFFARGRGLRERLGFLGKLIQPEKEVILIVTREEETKAVFDRVTTEAKLREPGKGFAYIQPVEQAVGFLEHH